MAGTQCDYPGCAFSAKEKCGVCSNIYCVRHIQLTGVIYTCDLCIQEAERVRREEERKLAEIERIKREIERTQREARERSQREALARTKILYPRITFVLSLIMFFPVVALSYQQPPLIQTNPPLAIIGVLGGILLFVSWIWVIVYAFRRHQKYWALGLIWFPAVVFYLILDPKEST